MYIYVDLINYKEHSCLLLFYTVSTLSRPGFESQVEKIVFIYSLLPCFKRYVSPILPMLSGEDDSTAISSPRQ